MMIRINLLPHRQLKRAEQQRQFNLMAVAVVVLGFAITFMGYTYINSDISSQNSRNQRLKDAIAKLDGDIKEIAGLKEKIDELKERIQAVESLQDNRSIAVSMLDEVARKLPEAVTLNSLKQVGDLVTFQGYADTNARVAELITNLSQSKALLTPQLVEVAALQLDSTRKVSTFTITAKLKVSTSAEDEKAKARPKSKGGKA